MQNDEEAPHSSKPTAANGAHSAGQKNQSDDDPMSLPPHGTEVSIESDVTEMLIALLGSPEVVTR
jgi:hypothetical protein